VSKRRIGLNELARTIQQGISSFSLPFLSPVGQLVGAAVVGAAVVGGAVVVAVDVM